MKKLLLVACLLAAVNLLAADTTDVILGTNQVANTIPFWGTFAGARFQTVFWQSDINKAGRIFKIAFMPNSGSAPTFNNLRFYLCHTNRTNDLSTTFDSNYDGFTPELVLDSASCTFNGIANQWLEFPVDFNYNNTNNLLWEIRWNGASGSMYFIYVHYVVNSEMFRVYNLGNDGAPTGSADYVRYHVKLTIEGPTGVEEVVIGQPPETGSIAVQPAVARNGRGVMFTMTGTGRGPTIDIYDAHGAFISRLSADASGRARWDMKDSRGSPVSPGVYFVRTGTLAGRLTVVD